MSWLLPLPVAVPLLAAAIIVAADHVTPRRVLNTISILAAGTATICSLLVLIRVQRGDLTYWFGGWHPDGGVALGIAFAADPIGAGFATLACLLAFLVLIYSWTYMREESRSYDVLILTFAAAMAGFSLTGDIFNMFVWFELMGVSAYALAGFKVRELGPLQGAVNFAVTNTVAAYMILTGIALLYGRTGALNLAQIGTDLAKHPPDRLVVVAFTLLIAGLLVKSAIVPFHFWLADAHAVAPAPVCVLFSGAMVELGIFFIARVYWTVFAGPLHAHAPPITLLLVWLGVATMITGAIMCLLQRHLKRMLAYSTISHAGAMLAGIALLDGKSLAGFGDLVVAHAFLKGALFLLCGIVLRRLRRIDELRLHGAGRAMPLTGVLWFACALGLAGIPYLGTFAGHALLDDGASEHAYGWLPAVTMVASALASGAMLRAGARVFLGWGPRTDPLLTEEPGENAVNLDANVALLTSVAGAMAIVGIGQAACPGLVQRTEAAAERFIDRTGYAANVLHGHRTAAIHTSASVPAWSQASLIYGVGAAALTVAVAVIALYHPRLPEPIKRLISRICGRPVRLLRAAHSGIIGDYLLWLVAGATAIGSIWAFTLT